jgi:hypothetical protein
MHMTRAEWIEVIVISIVVAGSWPARLLFPSTMQLWQVVLDLAALLLAQSLVRDIAILMRQRYSKPAGPQKETQCFCMETTVGVTGMVAAAALAGLGNSAILAFRWWEFSLAIAGTLAVGFLIKDLVISWNPLGVRREKDHLNLIVRWKRR